MGTQGRPPWYEDGWRDSAVEWIRAALAARGREVLDEIEDVRTWSLSCVLRAPTNVGPAYFKVGVDLPLFADEPRLARRLGELFPGHVPEVIAIDGERGWMLTADAGLAIG